MLGLLVAANIVWTGWKLLRRSTQGLMDGALSAPENALVLAVLCLLAYFGSMLIAIRIYRAKEL